jgi:pimeloyl-ACP methyl ester carboxylesterase
MTPGRSEVTVVLVHGAWHGAWCWAAVVDELTAGGIATVAVDLPGHGEDRRPLSDLAGDTAHVTEVLDGIGGPVVLVGHSYGGCVITGAGVHPNVRHLVYLCALLLDEGETAMSAATAEAQAAQLDHSGRPDLVGALRFEDDGDTCTIDPAQATALFFGDCAPDVAAGAVARLGPQRMSTLSQPATAVAWRERPSTYVVCEDDGAIHPGLQELLARRTDAVVRWPTSHSPFLSRPDLVADLVREVVRDVSLASGP